jgi:predicted 3-demethylubiquinone-9 3-methyltransferase (glyoxalase superfamily)
MMAGPLSITLWFDGQAEDAARYYTSIFKDSSLGNITYYGEAMPGEPGTVLTAEFTLNGMKFVGLNGGPQFKFNEAISIVIHCDSPEEVDYYWDRLTPGGDPSAQQCGWLKDKFGVSWQVVPNELMTLMGDPDKEKADRVTQAMLKMKKIDVYELRRVYAGE